MFKRIIVGIDGTKRGRDALALGRLLARETGASLVLASVYPASHRSSHEERARTEAERCIGEAREGLAGVRDVEHRAVAASSPARGLHDLAEAEGADLIVLGSSHRGAVGRVLPGSVGERLLHGAPCAVAVAPVGYWGNPDPRPRVIGVGFQPGRQADAALHAATELALHEGAALRLIAVVDGAGFGGFGVHGGYGYAEIIGDVREETRASLAAALDRLPAQTRAQGVLREGDVAAELVAQSQTLDLLVCGSRGYGPLGRAVLGGVSSRVVREAACPVLVIPDGTMSGGPTAPSLQAAPHRPQ
jgi:nucleotide-binding universal stress UspA family protein